MENEPPAQAEATAATDDPEIAALLEFAPVERRNKRHDGWSAEHQRGFIAVLARCGNVDRAAHAVDRTQSGAWTVRNSAGAEGFTGAWEGALKLYHRRAPPPLPRPARELRTARAAQDSVAAESEAIWAEAEAVWLGLSQKYWLKLKEERTCRLEGRIVEADFYVRQLSFIEIVFDLGGRAQDLLDGLRAGGGGGRCPPGRGPAAQWYLIRPPARRNHGA